MQGKKISNTEDFISKAIAVHGNRYDYSESIYVNSKTKVSIVCREHGKFLTRPSDHVNSKSGCPVCARKINSDKSRRSTEEYIELAKEKHGGKYDYSETTYTGALNNVKVICKEHGVFSQQANIHLRGANCPICTGRSFSMEKFLKKANEVHNCKYNYDSVVYIGSHEKISIECPVHGIFMQKVEDHLKGRGCPLCANERSSETQKMTKYQFLERAIQIHGNVYDYSLVEYTAYKKHVKILCNLHGVFEQTPCGHLKGRGCTECSRSSGFNRTRFVDLVSRYGEGYLYLVRLFNSDEDFYKIGITCRELRKRMNCFPFSKELIHVETIYDGGKLFDLENELHRTFRKFRYEPFTSFSGEKECYSEVDIEVFEEVLNKYKESV